MKSNVRKIVTAAMFTALTCVATMIVIWVPFKGYINLGDCVVLLSGWLLSPLYGSLSAGIGAMLADVILGYAVYAPATFVIKGLMALAAYFTYKLLHCKIGGMASRVIGGVIAEVIMVAGYYMFEGFMYGFVPSVANVPFNAIQGAAGLIVGLILVKLFEKTKIKFN